MNFLDQQAFQLLAGVPENVCIFCRHDLQRGEERVRNISILGRLFSYCEGCVRRATDLQGFDPNEEDIRNEFLQAQTHQCHVCGVTGATIICANVVNCGNKFHFPCRRDKGGGGDDGDFSRCSACAGNLRSL